MELASNLEEGRINTYIKKQARTTLGNAIFISLKHDLITSLLVLD